MKAERVREFGGALAMVACSLALSCGSRTMLELPDDSFGVRGAAAGARSTSGGAAGAFGAGGASGHTATGLGGAQASGGKANGSGTGRGANGSAASFGGTASGGTASGGTASGGTASGGVANSGGSAGADTTPIVLLLLDGSSSMHDSQVWVPTFEALTGPGGPIEAHQNQVRFGFVSYRGAAQTTEDDPACAELTSVPFAPSNSTAIRDTYAALDTSRRGRLWETPTGHAITRVTESLLQETTQARKYIVLISDGAPDTCLTTNPQCGQDRAVYAVQAARGLGIETYAIGIGFGNVYPGCTPDTARCASDHFQDVANAGLGWPVLAPPAAYSSLPCAAETGGELLASYSERGGQAPYFWTQGPEDVARALEWVIRTIAPR